MRCFVLSNTPVLRSLVEIITFPFEVTFRTVKPEDFDLGIAKLHPQNGDCVITCYEKPFLEEARDLQEIYGCLFVTILPIGYQGKESLDGLEVVNVTDSICLDVDGRIIRNASFTPYVVDLLTLNAVLRVLVRRGAISVETIEPQNTQNTQSNL